MELFKVRFVETWQVSLWDGIMELIMGIMQIIKSVNHRNPRNTASSRSHKTWSLIKDLEMLEILETQSILKVRLWEIKSSLWEIIEVIEVFETSKIPLILNVLKIPKVLKSGSIVEFGETHGEHGNYRTHGNPESLIEHKVFEVLGIPPLVKVLESSQRIRGLDPQNQPIIETMKI